MLRREPDGGARLEKSKAHANPKGHALVQPSCHDEIPHPLRAAAVANVPKHTVEVIQLLCMENEARAVASCMNRSSGRIQCPPPVGPSVFCASSDTTILTQNPEVETLHDPRYNYEGSFAPGGGKVDLLVGSAHRFPCSTATRVPTCSHISDTSRRGW